MVLYTCRFLTITIPPSNTLLATNFEALSSETRQVGNLRKVHWYVFKQPNLCSISSVNSVVLSWCTFKTCQDGTVGIVEFNFLQKYYFSEQSSDDDVQYTCTRFLVHIHRLVLPVQIIFPLLAAVNRFVH